MALTRRRKAGRLDQALTLMRTLQSARKQHFGLEMQLVSSAGTNSGCVKHEKTHHLSEVLMKETLALNIINK